MEIKVEVSHCHFSTLWLSTSLVWWSHWRVAEERVCCAGLLRQVHHLLEHKQGWRLLLFWCSLLLYYHCDIWCQYCCINDSLTSLFPGQIKYYVNTPSPNTCTSCPFWTECSHKNSFVVLKKNAHIYFRMFSTSLLGVFDPKLLLTDLASGCSTARKWSGKRRESTRTEGGCITFWDISQEPAFLMRSSMSGSGATVFLIEVCIVYSKVVCLQSR